MQVTQAVKIQYHTYNTIHVVLYKYNIRIVMSSCLPVLTGEDPILRPFLPNLGNYEGSYHWIITPLIYSWEKRFAGEAKLVSRYLTDKLVNKISAPLPSTPLHSTPLHSPLLLDFFHSANFPSTNPQLPDSPFLLHFEEE